jgi:hypothetical protein
MRLKIALPGREAREFLATASDRIPPYVWLYLEPLVPVLLKPAG